MLFYTLKFKYATLITKNAAFLDDCCRTITLVASLATPDDSGTFTIPVKDIWAFNIRNTK